VHPLNSAAAMLGYTVPVGFRHHDSVTNVKRDDRQRRGRGTAVPPHDSQRPGRSGVPGMTMSGVAGEPGSSPIGGEPGLPGTTICGVPGVLGPRHWSGARDASCAYPSRSVET
jgi:hypothetical protein